MRSFINGLKRFFAIRQMADFFEKVERNPVTRTPAEVGLDFEEVDFKSLDGGQKVALDRKRRREIGGL